ncbi:membrane-bound alkaline phosphatase [Drosophila tropicalis]|uniref:membrane-bound alkaline phosphatase n=1 Tax=Drosophila tropicalis TaxID=46794 RepID=UPI0035ABBBA8
MFRWSNAYVAIVGLSLLVSVSLAAPECTRSEEYCQDRAMHPELPLVPTATKSRAIEGENTNEYWREKATQHIKEKLSAELNKNKAKNIIFFLGDGMGVTTTSAARNLLGGEEKELSFERFPYTGLAKTYAVNRIVPDSACTATAYLCGVKAQEGTIGVIGGLARSNCTDDEATHVPSIAKWAIDAGKWSGVVTTTRVTHASPAGVYAHTSERDWENDQDVRNRCGESDQNVHDIGYQLANGEVGSQLKVILGGGKRNFVDSGIESWGARVDGRDLIEEFKVANERNVYVDTVDQLVAVDVTQTDRLFGLFNTDHMKYRMENEEDTTEPSLEQMTRKAIEHLSQNENGYFLFIEGGRIDQAHHENWARMALNETTEFSSAIQAARDLTNEDDTLIVVSADHSHVFTYGGYGKRGQDVLAAAPNKAADGKPYMVLNYANGPGYSLNFNSDEKERNDPTTVLTGSKHDRYPSGVPMGNDSHGGDDVPVFALGPWAHLFTGIYEQNTIPHIMAYAACLGEGHTMCSVESKQKK